jgi:hypothetical protein
VFERGKVNASRFVCGGRWSAIKSETKNKHDLTRKLHPNSNGHLMPIRNSGRHGSVQQTNSGRDQNEPIDPPTRPRAFEAQFKTVELAIEMGLQRTIRVRLK